MDFVYFMDIECMISGVKLIKDIGRGNLCYKGYMFCIKFMF